MKNCVEGRIYSARRDIRLAVIANLFNSGRPSGHATGVSEWNTL